MPSKRKKKEDKPKINWRTIKDGAKKRKARVRMIELANKDKLNKKEQKELRKLYIDKAYTNWTQKDHSAYNKWYEEAQGKEYKEYRETKNHTITKEQRQKINEIFDEDYATNGSRKNKWYKEICEEVGIQWYRENSNPRRVKTNILQSFRRIARKYDERVKFYYSIFLHSQNRNS